MIDDCGDIQHRLQVQGESGGAATTPHGVPKKGVIGTVRNIASHEGPKVNILMVLAKSEIISLSILCESHLILMSISGTLQWNCSWAAATNVFLGCADWSLRNCQAILRPQSERYVVIENNSK